MSPNSARITQINANNVPVPMGNWYYPQEEIAVRPGQKEQPSSHICPVLAPI